MTTFQTLRDGLGEVGETIRRPEALALKWRARAEAEGRPPLAIFGVLFGAAIFGMAAYGLTLGLHLGAAEMLTKAALLPLSAGLAWTLAMPALYIVGGALGSRLDVTTTVLAAAIACCFGATAMLASVPVNWFFTLALPVAAARIALNVVVFGGVGLCMVDVFLRVMAALEPGGSRAFRFLWVALLGVLGLELFVLFDLFNL